jgi:hypothetical protein
VAVQQLHCLNVPQPQQLPIVVTSQETSYNKLHCSFCRNPVEWQCVEENGNKRKLIGFDVKLSQKLPLSVRAMRCLLVCSLTHSRATPQLLLLIREDSSNHFTKIVPLVFDFQYTSTPSLFLYDLQFLRSCP